MANEISIQAALTYQRFSPGVQGSGTKDITAATSVAASNIQVVTTTATVLNLGGLSTPSSYYYVFLKNLDTAAIDIELSEGVSGAVFGRLKPDHFCLIPVYESKTIKARVLSGSSTNMLVVIVTTTT